jgi:putative flippase GtrA
MRNSTLQMIQSKVSTPEDRRTEMQRFAKFATVGLLGSITHFTILNVLVQFAGSPELLANALGFITAVGQNFFLNRRWTYPESRSRDARRQLAQFFLVSFIGFFLNMAVFSTVLWMLEPAMNRMIANPRIAHFIAYNGAYVVAVGMVLFWNFAANRLWTYRGLTSKPAVAGMEGNLEGNVLSETAPEA